MLKPFLLCSGAVLFGLTPALALGRMPQQAAPSQAPAAAQPAAPAAAPATAPATGVKNPVKPTAESQAKAKSLYAIDCAMCHGDTGNGQTDMAKSMEIKLGDFTDPNTLADKQDGDLFSLIRNGKGKMFPEPEGRANDTLVWNLILYVRGLAKTQAAAPAK